MNLFPLFVSLLSGSVGANFVGLLLRKLSLGYLGNSFVGLIGGAIGHFVAEAEVLPAASETASAMVSGGACGAVLLAITGLIRNLVSKK